MSYIHILERIEEGRFSVREAQKEIEKAAKKKAKKKAKKFSIYINADDVRFRFSGFYIGLINGAIKLASPFVLMACKKNDDEKSGISVSEMKLLLSLVRVVLKDFKKYPSMTLVSVKTKDTTVLIETK